MMVVINLVRFIHWAKDPAVFSHGIDKYFQVCKGFSMLYSTSDSVSGVIYPTDNVSPTVANFIYSDIFRDENSNVRLYDPE